MEIGLLFRWGKPVPGREQYAYDLYGEVIQFFSEKLGSKTITYFEPFLFRTSDHEREVGFFVVKGPMTEIFKMIEEDRYLTFIHKAAMLLEHFSVDYLVVGDEITEQLGRASKVRAELGF